MKVWWYIDSGRCSPGEESQEMFQPLYLPLLQNIYLYIRVLLKCLSWKEIFGFLCRRIIETIFARPPVYSCSCWIENWKLEKASVERAARCTNYFQICWDATELQRGVSPTNHKRTTINQRGRSLVTKVHSLRTKVKKKWKDLHPTIALRPDWVISFFPFFPFRISPLFQIWENVNFLRSWIFSSPKENI